MNKTMQKIKATFLASSILLSANASLASNAEDTYFYVGTELGISEPIWKSFNHKAEGKTTKISLKRSRMYGGRVGYSFYPNMMLELSWTHQPKFDVSYTLPELPGAAGLEHKGKTKMLGDVFTLNLIYEMEKQWGDIKPYVIAGAGIAKISVKPTITIHKNYGIDAFEVKKSKTNCLTTQFGVGLTKDLGDNFSVDLAAKMQYVKDIKIKYSQNEAGKMVSKKPVKQSVAVGEFTLGFIFKFPV